MIKILAIGNSFSQNTTELLQLTDGDIFVRNLYIGGCSLKTHAENIAGNVKAYDYQENGTKCRTDKVSIADALGFEKWDYVTVQQCSGESGIVDSFYPYLSEIISFVRLRSDAEIIWHMTWAYETGAPHAQFPLYDNDRKKMYDAIVSAAKTVSEREGLRVIRSGDAVEKARSFQTFDSSKGGFDITADGYHLTTYGRILTAGVWLKFFTGKVPPCVDRDNLSEPMSVIKNVLVDM